MNRLIAIFALVGVALAAGAHAQEPYPTRPITLIAPFPPGGVVDLTGRPLAAGLERVLKQPVVINNKGGAAGAVGRQAVAISKPDGYTLLVDLVSISTIPPVDALFERTPAYTLDQFVAIARLTNDLPLFVVNAQHPWKTFPELVAELKKRPGELTYASSGPYGASHVPMEWFLQLANLKMRHLPTTGGGPATTATLGNHAQMWVSPTGIAAPHIKSGKLRPLATFSATRHPRFPDVPTMKELGFPDLVATTWAAISGPAGISTEIVGRLNRAVIGALATDAARKRLNQEAVATEPYSPQQFTQFVQSEIDKWQPVARQVVKTN